jgi:hypothetical protein
MAITGAEAQRRFRQRQKEAAKLDRTDATLPYCEGFAQYLETRPFLFDETLDSLGIRIEGTPLYEQDQRFRSDGLGEVTMTSLERATALVGAFIDAAEELATAIATFKLRALDAAAEQAMKDAGEIKIEDQLKAKFAEVNRIHDIGRAMMKRVRHDFPKIEVKEGEINT